MRGESVSEAGIHHRWFLRAQHFTSAAARWKKRSVPQRRWLGIRSSSRQREIHLTSSRSEIDIIVPISQCNQSKFPACLTFCTFRSHYSILFRFFPLIQNKSICVLLYCTLITNVFHAFWTNNSKTVTCNSCDNKQGITIRNQISQFRYFLLVSIHSSWSLLHEHKYIHPCNKWFLINWINLQIWKHGFWWFFNSTNGGS